jgi:hypothetical protein
MVERYAPLAGEFCRKFLEYVSVCLYLPRILHIPLHTDGRSSFRLCVNLELPTKVGNIVRSATALCRTIHV